MTPIATPQYADLVTIQFQEGSYLSSLTSNAALPANHKIMHLTQNIPTNHKRYTSVQVSRDEHIELGNEFVYMNHSCDPSVALSTSARDGIVITTTRSVPQDGDLTFDYCSTEWDMDQPFQCTCGAGKKCRGEIKGAKYLTLQECRAIPGVNEHILALKKDQLAQQESTQ